MTVEDGDSKIYIFNIDPISGLVTPYDFQKELVTCNSPSNIIVSSDGSSVYVSCYTGLDNASKNIFAYTIANDGGSLNFFADAEGGFLPFGLTSPKDAHYIYTTASLYYPVYTGALVHKINFKIGEDSEVLYETSDIILDKPISPISLQLSKNGKFAYLPDSSSYGEIAITSRDEEGMLKTIQNAPIVTTNGYATGTIINDSGDYLYVSNMREENGQGGGIRMFKIDPNNGYLTLMGDILSKQDYSAIAIAAIIEN